MSDAVFPTTGGWFSPAGTTPRWAPLSNNEHKPEARPADTAAEAPAVSLTALSALKVLLVDDDKDTRYFLGVLLRRYGAEVHSAASAAEALDKFKEMAVDVLVSDIGMPEHSGYDLIGWIRSAETESKRRTPALALTAFGSPEHREKALNCGFDQHLPKPFEPLQVVRVIATLMGRL